MSARSIIEKLVHEFKQWLPTQDMLPITPEQAKEIAASAWNAYDQEVGSEYLFSTIPDAVHGIGVSRSRFTYEAVFSFGRGLHSRRLCWIDARTGTVIRTTDWGA